MKYLRWHEVKYIFWGGKTLLEVTYFMTRGQIFISKGDLDGFTVKRLV
jgi:hypothetical protein